MSATLFSAPPFSASLLSPRPICVEPIGVNRGSSPMSIPPQPKLPPAAPNQEQAPVRLGMADRSRGTPAGPARTPRVLLRPRAVATRLGEELSQDSERGLSEG